MKLQDLDDQNVRQRAKVDWIRQGDRNSSYFYATLKQKSKKIRLRTLYRPGGTLISKQGDIEKEVIDCYMDMMGTETNNLQSLDIVAMRRGAQMTTTQRALLMNFVFVQEIEKALKSITDLKAPENDGYGSKFFKATWNIVKDDMVEAVQEFFEKGIMYMPINRTLVTLIPKTQTDRTTKDYRPIAYCLSVYKIISKIMADRISHVLGSIISKSQATFVPE